MTYKTPHRPRVPLLAFRKIVTGLYFLPAFLTMMSLGLALLLLEADSRTGYSLGLHRWWDDPDSARDFLSTSASVMITIVSVAFSVVVVALTLASNQFCPRVLRRFVEDRMNRVVFGVLIGNFAYAMVCLSVIGEDKNSLPGLALTGCFLFDLVSTAFFIFFIHHIATSLQVDSIVTELRQETIKQIVDLKGCKDELWVLGPADGFTGADLPTEMVGGPFRARRTGYVQSVRIEDLLGQAEREGVSLHALVGTGDFLTPSTPCFRALSPAPAEEICRELVECFELDYSRLLQSDISYGFRQVVDIGVKAISPAINDPTTAVMCLHNLAAMFEALCRGGWPPTRATRSVEVTFPRNQPEDYLALCTDQLIHFAEQSPRVQEALHEFLARVGPLLVGTEWESAVERRRVAIRGQGGEHLPDLWRARLKAARGDESAVSNLRTE